MILRLLQATFIALLLVSSTARAGVVVESFGVISSDPQQDLFATIGSPTSPGLSADPGATEAWPVTVNLTHLQTLPGTVVLNLPNQSPETLSRIRAKTRGASAFMWSGGGQGCSALLSAIPGAFRATISCLDGTYNVETTTTGTRLTRFVYGDPPAGAENDVATVSEMPVGPDTTSASMPESINGPASLDQDIDVLILYTATVRQTLQASSINVQQYMQDTLDTTQMAMDRSTTPGQPTIATLNLVHSQEVLRPDTGYFTADVVYLQNDPEPVGIRNQWAADIVMYIRETSADSSVCGRAYVPGSYGTLPPPGPGFAPYAVGVTKRTCSFSGYPFEHEFGHIFGANHDPANGNNSTPLQPWAYAHWANNFNKDGARTLVAYKDSNCISPCNQVLNYSNASVSLTIPWVFRTGRVDQRENARVIAQYASTTAQYRASLDRIFANGFE